VIYILGVTVVQGSQEHQTTHQFNQPYHVPSACIITHSAWRLIPVVTCHTILSTEYRLNEDVPLDGFEKFFLGPQKSGYKQNVVAPSSSYYQTPNA
jgi:hypothetical protein